MKYLSAAFISLGLIASSTGANATALLDSFITSRYSVPGSVTKRVTMNEEVYATQTVSEGGAVSSATVDTEGGVLRSYSSSPMPATQGSLEQYITTRTSASIYDSVQFSGTNSFSGALQITFMGSLRTSDYVDFTNTKSSMTWAQISHLSNIGGLFSSDAIAIASDCQGTPEPGCVVGASARTEFLIPFTVTNTARQLNFQITLATQSFLDSEADFGHSAYLRLSGVPDDVTFTSGSGQFLLNPVAIPAVPEPEAFAMLLAGIGLIGLKLRRRSERVPSLTL